MTTGDVFVGKSNRSTDTDLCQNALLATSVSLVSMTARGDDNVVRNGIQISYGSTTRT